MPARVSRFVPRLEALEDRRGRWRQRPLTRPGPPKQADWPMETFQCPVCDATLPGKEAADGWCEKCGKKLPSAIVACAAGSKRQRPSPGATGEVNTTMSGSHWSEAFGLRGYGCVLLLFGTIFSYWGIYSPLVAAARQEERVSLFRVG